MIFAVRDRLRAEQRHLAATRERLDLHARHVVADAESFLAGVAGSLAAYDPQRRLAQGWSIVTSGGASGAGAATTSPPVRTCRCA